jgi:hypothetical protein
VGFIGIFNSPGRSYTGPVLTVVGKKIKQHGFRPATKGS